MWMLIVCILTNGQCTIDHNLTNGWLNSTVYTSFKDCAEAKSNFVINDELKILTKEHPNPNYTLMCVKNP